jgi:peptidoglycan hydrolase CwlO-like protein
MGTGIIFAFLKSWWKELLFGAIILAGVLYMRSLYSTIDSQAHKITELTTANGIFKENNEKLTTAINSTTASIDKLAKGADQTNKAFAGLTGTVKAQSNNLDSRLAAILKDKKPVTCEATIQYLIDAAKEFKK